MIVFKYFFKVLNKCKAPIIMFTVMLVFFGGFNLQTNETNTNFVSSKPDILIINEDEDVGVTKNLVDYISNNATIKDIKNDEEAISDALFYRDVNYIIYIPKNYREDFLSGKNPKIEIKATGDYQSSYAEMLLNRYLKVSSIYQGETNSEDELISKINSTLDKQVEVELTSSLDTNSLSRATFFYNFANYSILAGCVYVITLIISSFKEKNIKKRTIVSSMNYKKYNRALLLSNAVLAIALWVFYVIVSIILIKDAMFTMHGLYYILNSFVFTICALAIALLIGNLVSNKNAINGIVNVIALGSSFLCGAFVPMEWLPDAVLKIAHILPSYWYIQTNETLKTIETFDIETIKPILINMGVVIIFTIGFVIINNIITSKKRKIG